MPSADKAQVEQAENAAAAERAIAVPHKVAREYALAAARLCETSMLQPATQEKARRLLRAAIALLE